MDVERLNLLTSSQDIQIDIQIFHIRLDDVLPIIRDVHHVAPLTGYKDALHDRLQIVCTESFVKPLDAAVFKPIGWLLYLLDIRLDHWWYARVSVAQQGG